MTPDANPTGKRLLKPLLIAVCLVTAVAVFFLWEEHESHILGALFWLLLLACPLIHVFLHRGHGHRHGRHTRQSTDHGPSRTDSQGKP